MRSTSSSISPCLAFFRFSLCGIILASRSVCSADDAAAPSGTSPTSSDTSAPICPRSRRIVEGGVRAIERLGRAVIKLGDGIEKEELGRRGIRFAHPFRCSPD
ncbi:glutamine dumper [Musa troglodytarum]|uniref:Glutamine dumper n=1 Tax=Musa troglodytarum TaxID=320322 RepID=A0A9E7KUC7_9LILI|nr:glutamine dumper [Musa troglodytarum]URE29767.1 glutamine dumper [Musa troglodytarum]